MMSASVYLYIRTKNWFQCLLSDKKFFYEILASISNKKYFFLIINNCFHIRVLRGHHL